MLICLRLIKMLLLERSILKCPDLETLAPNRALKRSVHASPLTKASKQIATKLQSIRKSQPITSPTTSLAISFCTCVLNRLACLPRFYPQLISGALPVDRLPAQSCAHSKQLAYRACGKVR
jgi:hypothetical protein